MKAITLEELSRIQADYKIPKDVRVEKEIEDLAFDTMEWTGWHKPECLMPDMEQGDGCVLAIISGAGNNVIYEHAYVFACWNPNEGWYLEHDDVADFTVEKWAYLPEVYE